MKYYPNNLSKSFWRSALISLVFLPIKGHGEHLEAKSQTLSGYRQLKEHLVDLNQQIRYLTRTITAPGLGAQTIDAVNAFQRAQVAFNSKDWTATVNETITFLNLSQAPDPSTWMRAQHMLGRAYEEKQQYSKASRAYSRYLATYSTSPEINPPELTEVFERIVRLSTKQPNLDQKEISRFLSSILVVERSPANLGELNYLSALASSNVGNRNLAIKWLDQVNETKSPQDIKARAKYLRALISMNAKDWKAAAAELEAIPNFAEISESTRNSARISYARVLLKLKKPKLALDQYNLIPKDSVAYKDASYEKIFLLIRLNNNQEARDEAQKWLAENTDHPDAVNLRTISSWLDLRSGELSAAESGINKTTEYLRSIQSKIKNEFHQDRFTHEDAVRLRSLTFGQTQPSDELDNVIHLFNQLGELRQRLFELDGVERTLIYRLANADLAKYRPAAANLVSQYQEILDKTLKAGTTLAWLERKKLDGRITQMDAYKIDRNTARRERLFGQYETLRRQESRWAQWLISAEQLSSLAKNWDRLSTIEAKTASTKMANEKDPEANELTQKIIAARTDMRDTLRNIQKNLAQNIANQSEITDLSLVLEDFDKLLYEDFEILSAYQPEPGSAIAELDDNDAKEAWKTWKDSSLLLQKTLQNMRSTITADLTKTIEQLDQIDKEKSNLMSNLDELTSKLESVGAECLPKILSHFDTAISQRIGRQLKWAGDLEYLRYAEASDDRDKAKRKRDLELRMLSDEIRDNGQRGLHEAQ